MNLSRCRRCGAKVRKPLRLPSGRVVIRCHGPEKSCRAGAYGHNLRRAVHTWEWLHGATYTDPIEDDMPTLFLTIYYIETSDGDEHWLHLVDSSINNAAEWFAAEYPTCTLLRIVNGEWHPED